MTASAVVNFLVKSMRVNRCRVSNGLDEIQFDSKNFYFFKNLSFSVIGGSSLLNGQNISAHLVFQSNVPETGDIAGTATAINLWLEKVE